MEDEEIIKFILDGNKDLYSKIIDKYKNVIFDLCYRYTYNYADAEDLSQEIFLRVYKKLDTYKNKARFYTWLYRVGINICIDWVRKNKKSNKKSLDEEDVIEIPSYELLPEETVLNNERRKIVQEALGSLPQKYNTVLILYNYKNLSCSEIAIILNLPIKTVETRLYRGKKILRDKLLKNKEGSELLWNAAR